MEEPFTIAYETIDYTDNIFALLSTDKGITGMGCVAPVAEVTGETIDSVMEILRDIAEPIVRGKDPLMLCAVIDELRRNIRNSPAAVALIDMALCDIIGKMADLPFYRLLGGGRHFIETSMTIGILPLDDTIRKARDMVRRGFTILKIKGGLNCEEDIEKLVTLRESLGRDIRLGFDANMGYTKDEGIRFGRATDHLGLAFIEQPTSKGDRGALGEIARELSTPVMADESLLTANDAFELAAEKAVDMLNVKISKVGGIREALAIDTIAREAGIGLMIGCMDESALGIAAGLHVALSRTNVVYADLDGHFGMIDDPAAGGVICKHGVLHPVEKPGFGVTLNY